MRSTGVSFSSRFHWGSRPNALTALLAEKRRSEAPVLDLTESNPTHAGIAYPQEEILGALSDARALRYDPDPRGMFIAREAVSRYYAGRGVDVDPSRIILTASTSEAYSYLFKLLTDPGDAILAPRPSYPLFEYLAAMESVEVRQYPLRYDGVWHIDFAALENAAGSDAARLRAIVIVNPNNPTGSYLKRDEWARLAEWAAERGLAILSDEVFSDFALIPEKGAPDGERVATLAAAEEAPVFTMSGLSKTAGLPQMKLGWIVASGPGRRAALDGLEWIADTYLSVATPVQLALDRLLEATESVRDRIRVRTADNLATARAILEAGASSVCRVLNMEGGWNIVIQMPRTRSEEEWALGLLRDADVLVQPGFFYDFESEAYVVASLLTEPVVFKEGIGRLCGYVAG
ncbi:MAG TPA: pyridoxal phosphate-dependent aminotransferase [Bryobacteraceae bacterium]|nr:pyridoxal phosphate-dependent aminotransferase [Bryobacteraceae bacterium]